MRGVPPLGLPKITSLVLGIFMIRKLLITKVLSHWRGAMVGKEAGIVSKPSSHSVDQAVDKLKDMLKAKDVTLFRVIDSECPSQFHPMLMQYPGNS